MRNRQGRAAAAAPTRELLDHWEHFRLYRNIRGKTRRGAALRNTNGVLAGVLEDLSGKHDGCPSTCGMSTVEAASSENQGRAVAEGTLSLGGH